MGMSGCAAKSRVSAGRTPPATAISRSRTTSAKIEAVIWKIAHARMRFKPQEGLEVIATGRLTTYPGSSKYQIVIEALEPAGVGALMALMEERKRKLAAEGPVRRGAQAAAAVAAGGDRRRHLADRRGDPRHPAPAAGPLSAPRAGVAGAGAGRRLGRTDRRCDPRFQRAAGGVAGFRGLIC